jgi:hypothetical protein
VKSDTLPEKNKELIRKFISEEIKELVTNELKKLLPIKLIKSNDFSSYKDIFPHPKSENITIVYEELKKITEYDKLRKFLKYFSFIDPTFTSEAETHIDNYFNLLNCFFEYKNHEEIIIVDEEQLKKIQQEFSNIGRLYGGIVSNVNLTTNKLMHEMEILKITHKNELMKTKYENELLKKDIIILNLKK